MLWSLIKILSFVAMVMLISFGAGRLMEAQGGVMIQYAGLELSFGALQAALLVLGLLVSFWLVLKLLGLVVALLRFINGDETALSRYFDRNRERRGFEALSDGLMALASGDGRDAMAKAKKSRSPAEPPGSDQFDHGTGCCGQWRSADREGDL